MNHPGIVFSTASCVAQQSCLCSENNQVKKRISCPPNVFPPTLGMQPKANRVLPLPIPQHRDQQSHGDKSAPSDAAVYPQKVLHHSFFGGDPRWSTSPSSSCAMPSCGKKDARNARPLTKHCRQPRGGIGKQTGRSERIENDKTQGTPMFPGTRSPCPIIHCSCLFGPGLPGVWRYGMVLSSPTLDWFEGGIDVANRLPCSPLSLFLFYFIESLPQRGLSEDARPPGEDSDMDKSRSDSPCMVS